MIHRIRTWKGQGTRNWFRCLFGKSNCITSPYGRNRNRAGLSL